MLQSCPPISTSKRRWSTNFSQASSSLVAPYSANLTITLKMNHIYHSFNPLVLLTAFLLLILTFASPVMILPERVASMKVKLDLASSANKRWVESPYLQDMDMFEPASKMLRRPKLVQRAPKSSKSSTASPVTLYYGPLGGYK